MVTPILPPSKGILVLRHAHTDTLIGGSGLKRERYERAGVASYWVVDPAEPSLTAWELRDATYEQAARVAGDEPWTATAPYPVTIVPSALLE